MCLEAVHVRVPTESTICSSTRSMITFSDPPIREQGVESSLTRAIGTVDSMVSCRDDTHVSNPGSFRRCFQRSKRYPAEAESARVAVQGGGRRANSPERRGARQIRDARDEELGGVRIYRGNKRSSYFLTTPELLRSRARTSEATGEGCALHPESPLRRVPLQNLDDGPDNVLRIDLRLVPEGLRDVREEIFLLVLHEWLPDRAPALIVMPRTRGGSCTPKAATASTGSRSRRA